MQTLGITLRTMAPIFGFFQEDAPLAEAIHPGKPQSKFTMSIGAVTGHTFSGPASTPSLVVREDQGVFVAPVRLRGQAVCNHPPSTPCCRVARISRPESAGIARWRRC
jgi:hypothetical protein